ncbi:MAG: hypothetical protein ACXAB7_14870 [Candidatus Kariarchaeaceae archaeon]
MKFYLFSIILILGIQFVGACSYIEPEHVYLMNLRFTDDNNQVSAEMAGGVSGAVLVNITEQQLVTENQIVSFTLRLPELLEQPENSTIINYGDYSIWTLQSNIVTFAPGNETGTLTMEVPATLENSTMENPNHTFFTSKRFERAYLFPVSNIDKKLKQYYVFSLVTGEFLVSHDISNNYHFSPMYQSFNVFDSEGMLLIPLDGAVCVDNAYYRYNSTSVDLLMEDNILQSVILDSRSQQIISVSYDYDTTDSVFEIVNYITLEQTNFRFTATEISDAVDRGITKTQLDTNPILATISVLIVIVGIRKNRLY